mgnify:CR=1 FL=1
MSDKKKPQLRERKQWTKEEKEFLKLLGENIIHIKKKTNLKSKNIYEELEIDKSNYRRIEAGKTNVSVLLLRRISKMLGIPCEELIKII